ncbi:MAG: hypothetical protein AABW83_01070 [Nanoarchaeota archaeon]
MKKSVLQFLVALIFLNITLISAINLEVSSKPISNSFVVELNDPVIFDLIIKNLGEKDSFDIYSLVGINITYDPFTIGKEETEIIRIYLTPQDFLKSNPKPYTFEYKIKNSKKEIQSDTLTINILKLDSVFSVDTEPINPKSDKIIINIRNNIMKEFKDINFKFNSEFFKYEEKISLNPNEKKYIIVSIDKEKLKTYAAGDYLMNSQISLEGHVTNIKSRIRFLETEEIEVSENKEGILIQKTEIIKKNTGNTKQLVSINKKNNFIAYLFTITNIPPTKTEKEGFYNQYIWEKVLNPDEELKVITRTNWLFPILIIIIIIIGIVIIKKYLYDNLELTKKVSFVKTKGGEFALKVSIKIKAKKTLQNIRIIDRLPALVKLYDKFGIITPDKIDLQSRKIYWNINRLNKNETRIFTYIIYSKVGLFGRLELPETKAIYEDEGETKETSSNKSFYVRDNQE